jgi:hypothetical protein
MPRTLTAYLVAAAFIALLSCSSKPDFSPNTAYNHSTRFPETRSMSEAKLWLYWSKDERLAFLRGFVIAYRDGAVHGCLDAFERFAHANSAETTFDNAGCYQGRKQFDRDVGEYETFMTSFYKTYFQDDDVPIRFLLEELASHKTPAEIHNALTPRGS